MASKEFQKSFSERYKIPFVVGRKGRFCPYCGRSIANYSNTAVCPGGSCMRQLPHGKPVLPTEYRWCPRCDVGYYKVDWRFCGTCRWTTPFGAEWNKLVSAHKKKIAELSQELESSIRGLSQLVTSEPSSASSKSSHSQSSSESPELAKSSFSCTYSDSSSNKSVTFANTPGTSQTTTQRNEETENFEMMDQEEELSKDN